MPPDCGRTTVTGQGDCPNVDLPVVILDNDFRDPDAARYLKRFDQYDPSAAVLGDVFTRWEAERYQDIVDKLQDEYPFKEYVLVPKCNTAFDELGEGVTLGMPLGYSDESREVSSDLSDWRGKDIHLLGGNPHKQYETIQELTQPTVIGHSPANIVGMNWNGPHKGALMGENWTPDGWKPADSLSIRDTVKASPQEIKGFWQDKGMLPDTEPRELFGPAVQRQDFDIFIDKGGDPIPNREGLELAYVTEYEEYGTFAFESKSHQQFIEWREGLEPVSES